MHFTAERHQVAGFELVLARLKRHIDASARPPLTLTILYITWYTSQPRYTLLICTIFSFSILSARAAATNSHVAEEGKVEAIFVSREKKTSLITLKSTDRRTCKKMHRKKSVECRRPQSRPSLEGKRGRQGRALLQTSACSKPTRSPRTLWSSTSSTLWPAGNDGCQSRLVGSAGATVIWGAFSNYCSTKNDSAWMSTPSFVTPTCAESWWFGVFSPGGYVLRLCAQLWVDQYNSFFWPPTGFESRVMI